MSTLVENDGDYLPIYTKPFRGLIVYDPVTDTTRTNRAAMKFRVDRGGPTPDTSAGRARFGGALKFDDGNALYSSLYGKSNITVEAFVCTTGGVFNTFAPIVGSVGNTSWTNKRWALYMENDGSIAVRFTAGGSTSIYYSSGTGGRGKSKVNNGAWHHTIETFFKTRGRVSGGESCRQVVFKFGAQPWINVLFDARSSRKLLYVYYLDETTSGHYTVSDVTNIDDGNWHHVACVVNGTAQTNNICFYINYRLDKAFTGTLPNVSTGNSIFFGAKENGGGQFFDGWRDNYPSWTLSDIVVDGKWHHYAFTLAPKSDDDTKTSVQFFFDYNPHSMQTVNARIPYRFAGHKLMVGEGTYTEPNLQFEMDALRFSKGVLDPSRFLGHVPNGFTFIFR